MRYSINDTSRYYVRNMIYTHKSDYISVITRVILNHISEIEKKRINTN